MRDIKSLDIWRTENETVLILESDSESLGTSFRPRKQRADSAGVTAVGGEKFPSCFQQGEFIQKWVTDMECFLPTDFITFSFWRVGILSDLNDIKSILIIAFPLREQSCQWKNFLNFLINLKWLYFAEDCALKPLRDILYMLSQSSFQKNYTIKQNPIATDYSAIKGYKD